MAWRPGTRNGDPERKRARSLLNFQSLKLKGPEGFFGPLFGISTSGFEIISFRLAKLSDLSLLPF